MDSQPKLFVLVVALLMVNFLLLAALSPRDEQQTPVKII